MGWFSAIDGAFDHVAASFGAHVFPERNGRGFVVSVAGRDVRVLSWHGTRGHAASLELETPFQPEFDLGLDARAGDTDAWGRFYPTFVVHADEPTRAHELFGSEAQEALLDLLRVTTEVSNRPRVTLGDSRLTVCSFAGAGDDFPTGTDRWLDYLIRTSARAAELVERRARRVKPVASLAALAAEFVDIARNTSLETTTCPLGLAGRRRGIECRGRIQRGAPLSYRLLVEARFPEPLGRGLAISGAIEAPGFLADLFYGRAAQPTGDRAFDERFAVRLSDASRLAELLTPPARVALLELRKFGDVEADDRAVSLRSPPLPGAGVLTCMGLACDAVAAMVNAPPVRPVGPYR